MNIGHLLGCNLNNTFYMYVICYQPNKKKYSMLHRVNELRLTHYFPTQVATR